MLLLGYAVSLKELPRWWCGLASPEVGDGSEGATDASVDAGMVPVPVAATMAGSACCSSHCTVSPSDLLELRLLPPLPGLRHHLHLLLLLLPSAAPVLLRRRVNLDLQVVLRWLLLLLGGGAPRAASVPTASGTFEIQLQRFVSSLSRDAYLRFGSA